MGGMSELHATGAKELQAVQQPQQGTMVIDASKAFLDLVRITTSELVTQTYDEVGADPKSGRGKTHIGWGKLADIVRDHDELGLAVAIMANPINGNRRTKANVIRVKRIVIDFDGSPMPSTFLGGVLPTVIVQTSPAGFHAWLVLDRPLAVHEGEALAKRIAATHGGDTKACDAAHVYRLPGTWNRKPKHGAPFLVQYIGGSGQLVSTDALLAACPATTEAPKSKSATAPSPKIKATAGTSGLSTYASFLASAREVLTYFPMEDYREFIEQSGMPLHHETHGSPDGLAIWKEAASRSPKYNEAELDSKWSGFGGHRKPTGKGTLFWVAEEKYKCDLSALGRKYPNWDRAQQSSTKKKTTGPTTWGRNRGKGRYLALSYDLLGSKRVHAVRARTERRKLVSGLERGDIPVLLAMYDRHDGKNNGAIEVTAAFLGSCFSIDKDAAGVILRRIVTAGYAICTIPPRPNPMGGGIAGRYELTSLPTSWVEGKGYTVPPKLCWKNEPALGDERDLPPLVPNDDAWGNPEARGLPGSPYFRKPSPTTGARASGSTGARGQKPSPLAGTRMQKTPEFHPHKPVQSNLLSTREGEGQVYNNTTTDDWIDPFGLVDSGSNSQHSVIDSIDQSDVPF